MKVQLVSLPQPYPSKDQILSHSFYRARLQLVIDIINHSDADLILFSGWAACLAELQTLQNTLNNKNVTVVLDIADKFSAKDLKEAKKSKHKPLVNEEQTLPENDPESNASGDELKNCLYLYKGGQLINLCTKQVFATSSQADGTAIEALLKELKNRRKFTLGEKNCLVLQCGEINILRNEQSNGNAVYFRLKNAPDLENDFNTILNGCDIILNPIHYPMGNQGKMKQRRIFLSQNGRAYFSSANTDFITGKLGTSHQYAYHEGSPMLPCTSITTKSSTYEDMTCTAFINSYII